MSAAAEPKVHKLSGDITFDTVPQLWRQTAAMLADGDALTIDLSEVKRADSAALALLIGWLRRARQAHRHIEFRHIPDNLLAMARVTGVDGMLSGEPAPTPVAP